MDPWPIITANRERLGHYLGDLSPEEWDSPSLCAGWSVKGVAAHMLVVPTMAKGRVFLAFASSGFNLDKMSAKLVDRLSSELTCEQIAATTLASAASRSLPPGLQPMSALGEVLVHATDISEGVGRSLDLPIDDVVTGLEFMKDVQPVLGCKERIAGLRLSATDAAWSTGDGPLVEGSAQLLLAAMTGRRAPLDQLVGDGVEALRAR